MTPPLPKTNVDFTKHSGFRRLKSGKWLARIWHPSNKVWVLLGTYSSHEEAENAYTTKKLEYESLSVQEIVAPIHTDFTDSRKHPGVRRTSSGKWGAQIKHNKVSVWLGTYDTEKEAADAYNVSKLEYDSQRIRRFGAYATAEDAEEALNRKKCELGLTIQQRPCRVHRKNSGRHVYMRKNGRWQTEIRNPLTKARLYLGTFDTAEEAKEAYNKKRREFDLMVLACKKHKHSNVDCKMEAKQSKDAAAVGEGKSDSAYESGKPSVSIDKSLVIRDVSGEDTGVNIINVYDQNMQKPFSESKGEIDLGIINSYGQLVGQYSRMDDELWLC